MFSKQCHFVWNPWGPLGRVNSRKKGISGQTASVGQLTNHSAYRWIIWCLRLIFLFFLEKLKTSKHLEIDWPLEHLLTLNTAICVRHTPIQFAKILETTDANIDSQGVMGPIMILHANNGWKNVLLIRQANKDCVVTWLFTDLFIGSPPCISY